MHRIKRELLKNLKDDYKSSLHNIENLSDSALNLILDTLEKLSTMDRLSDYETVSNLNKTLDAIEEQESIDLSQLAQKYGVFWLRELKLKDSGERYE